VIGRRHHIVIDCQAPLALAQFYAELLGLAITYQSDDWVVISENDRTSGFAFQRAPDHQAPTWPDPARPQQFHIDVMVEDPDAAGPQVVAIGATRIVDHVYVDPAGHPFCLVRRPQWAPPIGCEHGAVQGWSPA
jgi:catechol 2,3-dioxygenase-like lactoylglutathione lyase family enzyme